MTDQKFDERIKQIEEEYGKRREGADAYRDQELARLFNECRRGGHPFPVALAAPFSGATMP